MPYIYISSTRIHKECVSLLICFLIAIGFNVYAIIHYDTPWSELWTALPYVLMATAVLYFVWVFLRLLASGVLYLVNSKKRKS